MGSSSSRRGVAETRIDVSEAANDMAEWKRGLSPLERYAHLHTIVYVEVSGGKHRSCPSSCHVPQSLG